MKSFNVSYSMARQVNQTIQLYTNDYEPYQIIKMLNSGEIEIIVQSKEKQLVIFKHGISKVIGSMIKIDQKDNEQYSFVKVVKEHWATKLDFSTCFEEQDDHYITKDK